MATFRDEPAVSDLVATLIREVSTLARQEVQLAKADLRQSATEAGRGIASLLIGGFVAYAGLLVLLAAIVLGLYEFGLDLWLSALIVSVVVLIIGAILIAQARRKLQASNLAPRATVTSLKEDGEWVKEQIA
jgi:hypothetical protein